MDKAAQTTATGSPSPCFTPVQHGLVQRKCACGGSSALTGECADCEKQKLSLQPSTQNSEVEGLNDKGVPPIVHEVLNSSGQPLDQMTRAFMEPRFGHDFSRVRVHSGARAADSARAVNALAYTVGQDVVFGAGQYRPDSVEGRSLLTHELTHTIQQGDGSGFSASSISGVGDAAELEAEKAAQVINDGGAIHSVGTVAPHLARQADAGLPGGVPSLPTVTTFGVTPSAPPTGCKVDVRATHIGGILSSLPIWHTFVVYTDTAGAEFYFRGGPGGSCPKVDAGQYGTITTNNGPYTASTVDWSPGAPSVTVLSGPTACGRDSCFASQLSRINGLCTPYAPTGPNSNTVAKTLLSKCGVPVNKPVTVAPGWGDPDL